MIILIGPSASGKTAVGKCLEEEFNIKKVVTYTTRAIRKGETNGIDYNFLTKEEFLEKKEKGFFFETMEYQNNFYGTSCASIKDNRYMILDLNGYDKYIQSDFFVKAYYLECDKTIRERRMILRGDSIESVLNRLSSDDSSFSLQNRKFNGLIIDSSNLTIKELARLIYEDYRNDGRKNIWYIRWYS